MSRNLRLSFDFDDTITADEKLFAKFIILALTGGCDVYIVTFRHKMYCEEIDMFLMEHNIKSHPQFKGVFYTNGVAKEKYMLCKMIDIDIWIDDTPAWVVQDL